jgi:hypothetical protein
MNFSRQRTALQAFGWYLTFLLTGIAIGGLAGAHLEHRRRIVFRSV